MKRIVLVLVLAMAAPLYAADVTFGVDVSTAGQATITYYCDGTVTKGPVGMALNVDASAAIDSVDGVDSFFDILMDVAYDMGAGYTYGAGTNPAANQTTPGQATLPSASFAISIAGLGGAAKPITLAPIPLVGAPGTVAVLHCAAGAAVTVDLNAIRAGVVNKDGAMTTSLDGAGTLAFTIAPSAPPICVDQAGYSAQLADYNAYVAAGADPSCWCEPYQCDGDANIDTQLFFKYRVYTNDFNKVIANWKKKIATADPCADVVHDSQLFFKYRVYTNDFNRVVNNWKAKDAALAGDCPRPDASR